MAESAEQLKQEISEQYIKEFKKELGWLKSLALLPIEKKVKKILTGEINLPDKFNEVEEFGWWKNVINFVSPETAKKIFEFMREKRLEIERRRTEKELRELKNEILGIPTQIEEPQQKQSQQEEHQDSQQEIPQQEQEQQGNAQEQESQYEGDGVKENSKDENKETDAVVAGAVASGVGFGATMAIGKISEAINYRKLSEGLDGKNIRKTIESGIASLENFKKYKKEIRLSDRQEKTLEKHIKKLKAGLKDAGNDSLELLRTRGELDNKLPRKVVEAAGISQSQMLKLEKVSDKMAELIQKSNAENVSEEEILKRLKSLLTKNNVTGITDEVLTSLAMAKNATEIKKMAKILRHGTKLNRFVKTLKGALLIDVACLGLDVRAYIETQKEAELIEKVNEIRANNKKNQSAWQFGIGIGSVVFEGGIIVACTLAGTSTGGWVGALVGLGVGALATGISMGVDSYYFDVQDFYLQNKEDFIREKKSKINQAILQGIYNRKNGNISLNEKIGSPDLKEKEQSLRDACWSMIFLDEIQDGKLSNYAPFLEYATSGKKKEDYMSNLDNEQKKQFNEKRKELEKQIAQRMEFIDKNFQGNKMVDALKNGKGMDSLNVLFTESRIYAEMKAEGKRNERTNFETNLRRYKGEYFSNFPKEKLNKLEKLKQDNPLLFQELMVTASLTSLLLEDEKDSNYTENVKLVKAYQDWLTIIQTDKEKIAMEIPDSHKNVNFIEKFLEADFDITKVKFGTINEENLIGLIGLHEERYGDIETSDDPFQNTLYRLAKELFGYTGKNTKEGVMEFYSEEDRNVHGIYYKDAWIINNDWAKDGEIKGIKGRGKVFNSQTEVDKYIDNFMADNMNGDSIDTATESIDNYLQKEFKIRFRSILKEELSPRTKDSQERIKREISDFVKNQAKDGKYVELPYYLLIKARKVGLGDLQRQFFTWKNGKLEVCLMPSELSLNTLDANVTYLSPAREEFTEEENIYIDRVERAHADVENIRALGGTGVLTDTFTDELDLPKEIEILISDKYKEREKFKSDMMMYSSDSITRMGIYEKYKEFAEYFENLYRGILMSLTTFTVSNDVDSYALFSRAISLGNMDYFDEKGNLKQNVDNKFLDNEELKSFYKEQISKQNVEGKTIQELRNSERLDDRELALQGSKLIVTTILEESMLSKDKNGEITNIHIGGHRFDSDTNNGFKAQKAETENKIAEKLFHIVKLPVFNKDKIDSLMKPQSIKQLKGYEKKAVKETSELQKKIENTKDDVVWQGKRGNIEYNPEKGILKSWGQEVKIEEKNGKYYIEGFDYTFQNIKEMLRVANFRNRAKAKFHGKRIEYDWDLFNSSGSLRYTLVVKESWPKSDTMLIARGDLEQFFHACKSDAILKKIAEWINNEVNK